MHGDDSKLVELEQRVADLERVIAKLRALSPDVVSDGMTMEAMARIWDRICQGGSDGGPS